MSVLLKKGTNLRKMDINNPPTQGGLDRTSLPVMGKAVNYVAPHMTPKHHHPTAQLIYAVHGVMVVGTDNGQWIVPSTRGIWMPAGTTHWVRAIGEVHMRTLYIRPDAVPGLPVDCKAVGISPLLRELILAAVNISEPYTEDSRDGRLMRLVLDEVRLLQSLPLHLPQPNDQRLLMICETIAANPDDASTLTDWSERLHIDVKTIQRLFDRETGMSFGQWRQQARLLAALEQLASGTKVVDVALNMGYASPGAFATMFKRQFGVAPSSFFATPS
jgi:AraC-like DNA-binding protein/mannose-6-phosphate isomerase-like protein (cupin superfamily)